MPWKHLFAVALCLTWGVAWAEMANPADIAFSDPTKTSARSQSWLDQPIQYEDWANKAAAAAILDQHLYPALLPLVQAFSKANNVDIAVREGTCGTSQGMVNRKQVDLAGYCCPPEDADRLPGIAFHTLGISALTILVHAENPVTSLSAEQIRDIFRGRITHWQQIPLVAGAKGLDLPIKPVVRLHCKTRPGHWRLILPDENHFGTNASEVGTIPEMMTSVADYPGAIGYEVYWDVLRYEVDQKVRPLRIDGVDPLDRHAVAAGKYPFYRVNNLAIWTAENLKNQTTQGLLRHILDNVEQIDPSFHIIPAAVLRQNGWQFHGDELTGEPQR